MPEFDDEMERLLDSLATGGMLAFTGYRVEGKSESESAFLAVRKTASVMTKQLMRQLAELSRVKDES